MPHTTHLVKYTTQTLKKDTVVLIRKHNTRATVTLVYKKGCCTVTGIEVLYDNGALEYFPRHDIPTEIILL